MARGRKRGTKLTPYTSQGYAFNLRDNPDEKPYRDTLDQWIADHGGVKARALVSIFKSLVDHYNGVPLTPLPQADSVLLSLKEQITEQIRAEMEAFIRSLIADGARFGQLADAHQQIQDGGDIPDDVIDNILQGLQ